MVLGVNKIEQAKFCSVGGQRKGISPLRRAVVWKKTPEIFHAYGFKSLLQGRNIRNIFRNIP